MDLIIAFFTFLPLHFWDAVNLLFTGPVDVGLLVKIVFYGGLTLAQYLFIFYWITRIFDRIFY